MDFKQLAESMQIFRISGPLGENQSVSEIKLPDSAGVTQDKALSAAEFDLPTNLRKLTLTNFRLPWDHISAIGRLPNLEILKLLSRAFEGERWDMTEGEFLKLKFLKLENLNISQWNATGDHLPNLRHLLVRSCKDLKEVPFDFAWIPTLEKIEVQWCSQSAEESVRDIEPEGIEGLKILTSHLKSHTTDASALL